MATALIKINGTAGSREDLSLDTLVTLTNNDDTGVDSWLWELLDKPPGSSASLNTPTSATATFTPDVVGSYLIRLTVSESAILDSNTAVGAVLTEKYQLRIPAAGETTEFSTTAGWHEALYSGLKSIDDFKSGIAIQEYNGVGDGITDESTAITNAQSAANSSSEVLKFRGGTWLIDSNLNITADIVFEEGAVLKPASGRTITISGNVYAGPYQIFDTSAGGDVSLGSGILEVFPEWWGVTYGGDCTSALQAAIAAADNKIIVLKDQEYGTTAELTVGRFVSIDGNGGTIKALGAMTRVMYVDASGGTPLTIRNRVKNLTIHGDSVATDGILVQGGASFTHVLENCRVLACTQDNIHLFDCVGGHFGPNIYAGTAGRYNIFVEGCNASTIDSAYVSGSTTAGVYVTASVTPTGGQGVTFDSLVSEAGSGKGVIVDGTTACTFINPWLEANTTGGIDLIDASAVIVGGRFNGAGTPGATNRWLTADNSNAIVLGGVAISTQGVTDWDKATLNNYSTLSGTSVENNLIGLWAGSITDGYRGTAGRAGRIFHNSDNGFLEFDDGSNIHRISSPITPYAYGAVGDGVANDDAAILSADTAAAAAGRPLVIPSGGFRVGSNLTLTAPNIKVDSDGYFDIDSGVTLTIDGVMDAGDYQVFSLADATAHVDMFSSPDPTVRASWFGLDFSGVADIGPAVNEAIRSVRGGGQVRLPLGTFALSTQIIVDWDDVDLIGAVHQYDNSGEQGTRLNWTGTGAAIEVYECRKNTLANFKIHCGSLTAGRHGIRVYSDNSPIQKNCTLSNISVQVADDGFIFGNGAGNQADFNRMNMCDTVACTRGIVFDTTNNDFTVIDQFFDSASLTSIDIARAGYLELKNLSLNPSGTDSKGIHFSGTNHGHIVIDGCNQESGDYGLYLGATAAGQKAPLIIKRMSTGAAVNVINNTGSDFKKPIEVEGGMLNNWNIWVNSSLNLKFSGVGVHSTYTLRIGGGARIKVSNVEGDWSSVTEYYGPKSGVDFTDRSHEGVATLVSPAGVPVHISYADNGSIQTTRQGGVPDRFLLGATLPGWTLDNRAAIETVLAYKASDYSSGLPSFIGPGSDTLAEASSGTAITTGVLLPGFNGLDPVASGLTFDPAGSGVVLQASDSSIGDPTLGRDWIMECVVKFGTTLGRMIISKRLLSGNQPGFELTTNGASKVQLIYRDQDGNQAVITSVTPVTTGKWHHIVIGIDADGNAWMIMDKNFEIDADFSVISGDPSSSANLTIGSRVDFSNKSTGGGIALLRFMESADSDTPFVTPESSSQSALDAQVDVYYNLMTTPFGREVVSYISPYNYGAKGDGTTDDRTALFDADAAAALAGVPLYLPPGTFKISSDLTLTAPTVVAHAGATVSIDAEITLTVTADLEAGAAQLFDLSATSPADQVWQVDADGGPSFSDQTIDFNDVGAGDFTPFPGTEATGDYVAFGLDTPFRGLTFDSTGGTQGTDGVVRWEYWNGTAWVDLPSVTDGTSGFTAALGSDQAVTWILPDDWATLNLNSVTKYYVRARVTTIYTINPVLSQGVLDGTARTTFTRHATVKPEWWGAEGNDSSPCSEGINQAIWSLSTQGGVVVFQPGGVYRTEQYSGQTRVLIDRSNVTLRGNGARLYNQSGAGRTVTIAEAGHFEFAMRDDGVSSAPDYYNVDAHSLGDHVLTTSTAGDAANFTVGERAILRTVSTSDTTPIQYQFITVRTAVGGTGEVGIEERVKLIPEDGETYQIGPVGWMIENIRIEDLDFYATGGNQHIFANWIDGLWVENNSFTGGGPNSSDATTTGNAAGPSGPYLSNCVNVDINGNKIFGCSHGITANGTENSAIKRNKIKACDLIGIYVDESVMWSDISENKVEACNWAGMVINRAAYSNIESNKVSGCGFNTDVSLIASIQIKSCYRSSVRGNIITSRLIGNTTAVNLLVFYDPSSDPLWLRECKLIIEGNIVDGSTASVSVHNGGDIALNYYTDRHGTAIQDFVFNGNICKGGIHAEFIGDCEWSDNKYDAIERDTDAPAAEVWQVDFDGGPSYVDLTTAFNNTTDNDVAPFPASEGIDDYIAIGFEYPFQAVQFDYANGSAGDGTGVLAWEYYNGSGWSALSGLVDDTADFTTVAADNLWVTWTMPTNWATLTINGGSDLYYIRARITTIYSSTNPSLDQGHIRYGTHVRENGELVAALVWNPTSLGTPPAHVTSPTLHIPGAALGDPVRAAANTGNTDGLILSGYVDDTDRIKLNWHQFSSGAVDPGGNGTYWVYVRKRD